MVVIQKEVALFNKTHFINSFTNTLNVIAPPIVLEKSVKSQCIKFTHLWEYICVFCCEHEPTFNEETGTGNKELGELLVGEVWPDFAVDVGIFACGEGML